MSLQNWLENGQIKAHRTSKYEISELFRAIDRDITDSQLKGLSADRRFATAYNAALLVSTMALAASGYRAQQEGHHYWSIQSLAFTLEIDAKIIKQLNAFRRKRNITDYERVGMASEEEIKNLVTLAKELRVMVVDWIKKNHPELI